MGSQQKTNIQCLWLYVTYAWYIDGLIKLIILFIFYVTDSQLSKNLQKENKQTSH